MSYGLIGDLHGHTRTLKALLEKLDYHLRDGVYRHATRRVVFLGDFIDRGPHQRETLAIVRGMIDGGSAMAAMANHEFNAIAYSTHDGGACLTDTLLARSTDKDCWEFTAVETLLKGKEIALPDGHSFKDSYGTSRLDIRICRSRINSRIISLSFPKWPVLI